MRFPISLAFLVAGASLFVLGAGPACFGEPWFGVPLLLAGLGLELAGWTRLRGAVTITSLPGELSASCLRRRAVPHA